MYIMANKKFSNKVLNDTLGPMNSVSKDDALAFVGVKGVKHLSKLDAELKREVLAKKRNLVYAGGVALNCAANKTLANLGLYDNIWIIPNPGDAGSSLGCIAASEKKHLNWQHPFLGHV